MRSCAEGKEDCHALALRTPSGSAEAAAASAQLAALPQLVGAAPTLRAALASAHAAYMRSGEGRALSLYGPCRHGALFARLPGARQRPLVKKPFVLRILYHLLRLSPIQAVRFGQSFRA